MPEPRPLPVVQIDGEGFEIEANVRRHRITRDGIVVIRCSKSLYHTGIEMIKIRQRGSFGALAGAEHVRSRGIRLAKYSSCLVHARFKTD